MKLEEIANILIAILLFALIASLTRWQKFPIFLVFAFIIISINILGKKLLAYYLDTDIEIEIWHLQRYYFHKKSYFKKPIPFGIILPIILAIISLGNIKWFAFTQFNATPLKSRVSKRHGLYRFSELTDFHLGIIAAIGIIFNLTIAIIAYILNLPELARLSVYFAFFNMLPISKLDGTKIFFGSLILWFVLMIISAIGLAYALILP